MSKPLHVYKVIYVLQLKPLANLVLDLTVVFQFRPLAILVDFAQGHQYRYGFATGAQHAHLLSLRSRQWTGHPNTSLRQQHQRRHQFAQGHVRQR